MQTFRVLLLLLLTTALTGCDLVGDLIELGFWVAIIAVVVMVALFTWLWKRIRGGGRDRRM